MFQSPVDWHPSDLFFKFKFLPVVSPCSCREKNHTTCKECVFSGNSHETIPCPSDAGVMVCAHNYAFFEVSDVEIFNTEVSND